MLAPLFNGMDIWEDENFHERGLWTTVDHPELGTLPMLGRPYILETTPWRIRSAAPRLGEHTNAVLAEAGFAPGRVSELQAAGVVA